MDRLSPSRRARGRIRLFVSSEAAYSVSDKVDANFAAEMPQLLAFHVVQEGGHRSNGNNDHYDGGYVIHNDIVVSTEKASTLEQRHYNIINGW